MADPKEGEPLAEPKDRKPLAEPKERKPLADPKDRNTAIFSLVDAVLLRPLNFQDLDAPLLLSCYQTHVPQDLKWSSVRPAQEHEKHETATFIFPF